MENLQKKSSYEVHAFDGEEWLFVGEEPSLEDAIHGAMTAKENQANGYHDYRVVVYI